MANTLTLAAIGCSGPVTEIFVNGFLDRGVNVRLLARDPNAVAARYPKAHVVQGSLMKPRDVARVCDGVDAAFVVTPMGLRDNPTLEIKAGKAIAEGARAGNLKHLIYTSVLGADTLRGVGILDAKYHIERAFAEIGVPRTIMRCGSYMEDVFDPRLALLKKGKFLFPLTKDRRFSYTSQRDVPRFVVEELLAKGRTLDRAFNFISPGTFSIREVEALLSEAAGFSVMAPNKFPTYYAFLAALPVFNLMGNRFSSILPLLRYFDRHGYVDNGADVSSLFHDFQMTTLKQHLDELLER